MFNGDYQFEVVHSQNVGTLVFSGYGHKGQTQVYIITQNPDWNTIVSSEKYLSPFQNPYPVSNYYDFGVVEQDNTIYLVGGWAGSYQHTIQVINFDNVKTIQDAQTRNWNFIESLKHAVNKPAMIYLGGELLIVGQTGDSTVRSFVSE